MQPSDAPWPDSARFALYTAPPEGSALAEFARAWLGDGSQPVARNTSPPVLGLSVERWRALTAAPRHYGFHGTLKAPFALAAGATLAALTEAVARFAAARPTVRAAPLALTRIAGFLALVPSADSPALDDLAKACVEQFDHFRRPESAEQVAQRRVGLTGRQSALLDRWGYPYVFEEFRFHMTLTERLDAGEAAWLTRALTPLARPALRGPFMVDAVCLFAQTDRASPFRLIRRFALAARP